MWRHAISDLVACGRRGRDTRSCEEGAAADVPLLLLRTRLAKLLEVRYEVWAALCGELMQTRALLDPYFHNVATGETTWDAPLDKPLDRARWPKPPPPKKSARERWRQTGGLVVASERWRGLALVTVALAKPHESAARGPVGRVELGHLAREV